MYFDYNLSITRLALFLQKGTLYRSTGPIHPCDPSCYIRCLGGVVLHLDGFLRTKREEHWGRRINQALWANLILGLAGKRVASMGRY